MMNIFLFIHLCITQVIYHICFIINDEYIFVYLLVFVHKCIILMIFISVYHKYIHNYFYICFYNYVMKN